MYVVVVFVLRLLVMPTTRTPTTTEATERFNGIHRATLAESRILRINSMPSSSSRELHFETLISSPSFVKLFWRDRFPCTRFTLRENAERLGKELAVQCPVSSGLVMSEHFEFNSARLQSGRTFLCPKKCTQKQFPLDS